MVNTDIYYRTLICVKHSLLAIQELARDVALHPKKSKSSAEDTPDLANCFRSDRVLL